MDMFPCNPKSEDETFLIPEARNNQNIEFNYFPNYEPQEISNKDLDVTDGLIRFNDQDVKYFLSLFQPTSQNLHQIVKLIFHSYENKFCDNS